MSELSEAAAMLIEAKKIENKAKADRIAAEELIAALVDSDINGSKTVDAGDGIKVTVKRAMGYKADVEGLRSLEGLVPLKATPPVPAGYAFDQKAYEVVMSSDDDALKNKLSEFVEAKPKKTSVTVKLA